MKNCKTCKWWAEQGEKKTRVCSHEKLTESFGRQAYADDALTYTYTEDGWFLTGPDFGCVHHDGVSDE